MAGRRLTALVSATVGACGAYFFDPDRGRARRARTQDRASAALRRRQRKSEAKKRYEAGVEQGTAARAAGGGEFVPEDDIDIVHALEAALAKLEVNTSDVKVDVVDGVATLRGQVAERAEIDDVRRAADAVPGVAEVQSYLHTPGTPAPNKAASLEAS
jgi:osmotically-inducible protein OsmY